MYMYMYMYMCMYMLYVPDFVITAVRYVVRSNSVFCVYIPWYDTVLTAVLALAWERFWQKWRGRSSHDSRGHAELEQRLRPD